MKKIQFASATVLGREHARAGKNCQDATHTVLTDKAAVAVVCDGCGSGSRSEVGAQLGGRILANVVACHTSSWDRAKGAAFDGGPFPMSVWEDIRKETLLLLKTRIMHAVDPLVSDVPWSKSGFVNDHLLFSIVGMAANHNGAAFFAIGDGYFAINGELISLGPFPGNAPPYLAYGLVETTDGKAAPKFDIVRTMPLEELKSFLLATDGLGDLIAAVDKQRLLPGNQAPVPPLNSLWENEAYFKNADALRRLLALANAEKTVLKDGQLVHRLGLLSDDTGIITGRQLPPEDDAHTAKATP